jgi:colicin import membrane protein
MLKIGLVVLVIVAAFFIYRSIALQSQFTQTRDERVQLQSRLDTVQAEVGNAEAKARELADQAAKLQSQVDQAKAEVTSAKADAEKASGDMTELQTQLVLARSQAAESKANAEKAMAKVAQLQAQAQTQAATPAPDKPAQAGQSAQVKPAGSSSKPMPLIASFKKSMMLDRTALAIQNTSTANLAVTVKFSNSTSSKEFEVTLEPGAVQEMGWLGLWILASGDKAEIKSAGYETIVKTLP